MEFNWFVQWMSIYLFNNIKPFVLFWKNNWIPLCFNCIPLFVFQWNSIDWFCSMEFHCFWTWTNQWHCIVAFFNWIQLIVSIEFRCFWCSMEFHWFFEFENTSMEFDCLLIEFHWFVSMESHWCFSIEFHWFVWIWKKQWMSIDFVFFSIEFHLFSMKVHWVLFCVSIDFHCVFFSCFCYLKTPMDFQWVCFSGIPLFFQHNSIAVFCSLEFHCVFFYLENTKSMEIHWLWSMEFHWLCQWSSIELFSIEWHWFVEFEKQWNFIDCVQWNSIDVLNKNPLTVFSNWIPLFLFEFETHKWNCIDLFQWNSIEVSMKFRCFLIEFYCVFWIWTTQWNFMDCFFIDFHWFLSMDFHCVRVQWTSMDALTLKTSM